MLQNVMKPKLEEQVAELAIPLKQFVGRQQDSWLMCGCLYLQEQ